MAAKKRRRKGDNTPRAAIQAARSPQQQGVLEQWSYSEQTIISGPLPDPEALAKYEEIHPGTAERLIVMAEKQGDHRREIEKQAIEAANNRAGTSLWLGWILALATIAAGTVIILNGYEVQGFALLIAEVVALVGAFVYGRIEQRRERIQKAAALQLRR